MTNNKREIRTIEAMDLRGVKSDAGTSISGLCIAYGSRSVDLGGFTEVIAPGACTAALASNDIFALYNHDSGKVLGRTSANTLTLRETPRGVEFDCLLPNNTLGNDLAVSMNRGDVKSCSFGFYSDDETWDQAPDGSWLRTITKANVMEITICPQPAYNATAAQVNRGLFPDGLPLSVRSHIPDAVADVVAPPAEKRDDSDDCVCGCNPCIGGDCSGCTNLDCPDENCEDCRMKSRSATNKILLRARLALHN